MIIGQQGATRVTIMSVLVVILTSSPFVTFVNPALAAPLPTVNSIPSAPSTTGQDGKEGDFTTQAALANVRTTQTNDIVNSKAYYDVSFRTATAGVIKHIFMDFPTGTSVGSALAVEVVGIGPGTLNADPGLPGRLVYTVTNAVNVPAITKIRIQISNINNPPNPSSSLVVGITTATAAFGLMDGTTATSPYNMVQVGNSQIAPGEVTTTKIATGGVTTSDIATSLGHQRELLDGENGWTPDNVDTTFTIVDGFITSTSQRAIVNLATPVTGGPVCSVTFIDAVLNEFEVTCTFAPLNDPELRYAVLNLPPA